MINKNYSVFYGAIPLLLASNIAFALAPRSAPANPFGAGSNVYIVTPQGSGDSNLDTVLTNKCNLSENANTGCAVLLLPDQTPYSVTHPTIVSYFTQVMGLGTTPDAVSIKGDLERKPTGIPNDTRTFWRSLENLEINGWETWSVSQGAPLRRVHITQGLWLSYGGNNYTSGGFMANSEIDGKGVDSQNQQQWMTRNTIWKGDWKSSTPQSEDSGVLLNTQGTVDPTAFNGHAIVQTDAATFAEKPYLIYDQNQFQVVVPPEAPNKSGIHGWSSEDSTQHAVPLSDFYIAHPSDSADTINNHLQGKKGIIFTPGEYKNLKTTINITTPDFVVLGLGYPQLEENAQNAGQPIMKVATSATGVRVAGLMFQDTSYNPSTQGKGTYKASLLQVGDAKGGTQQRDRKNESAQQYFYDIFVRIDSDEKQNASPAVIINDNNVVIDDMWLWARDNGQQAGVAQNGLEVNGSNVTVYGLAVEHFSKNQTLWNGDNGKDYFYQSELPYDTQGSGGNPKLPSSFTVAPNVSTFTGVGMGVYSVVGQDSTEAGISVPNKLGIRLDGPYSWTLSGSVDNIFKADNFKTNGSCGAGANDKKCFYINSKDPNWWHGQGGGSTVTPPTSLEAISPKGSTQINVSWKDKEQYNYVLTLKDGQGKTVKTQKESQGVLKATLNNIPKGTYTLSVVAADGTQFSSPASTTVTVGGATPPPKKIAINLYSGGSTVTIPNGVLSKHSEKSLSVDTNASFKVNESLSPLSFTAKDVQAIKKEGVIHNVVHVLAPSQPGQPYIINTP